MSQSTTTSRRSIHDPSTELAMIHALLSEKRWNREALRVRLEHLDQEMFDSTFARLVCEGVAVADRVDVQASRQLRYLDALGVLSLDAPNGSPPNGLGRETVDRILAAHRRGPD